MKVKCEELYLERDTYGTFVELYRYSFLPGHEWDGYVIYYGQTSLVDDFQAQYWKILPPRTSNATAIRKAIQVFDRIAKLVELRQAIYYARRSGSWQYCPVCSWPLRLQDGVLHALSAKKDDIAIGEAIDASCPNCGEGGLAGRLVDEVDIPSLEVLL